MGTDFIFHKTNVGNAQKLESIVNIFVFLIKISCQSKESPPLAQLHPFWKKYFIPTLISKLEEFNPSPLCKGGGGGGWWGWRFKLCVVLFPRPHLI